MDKLKEKFKQSYFVVNRLYLFLIFIILSISDATLGFIYFIASIFLYIWKVLRSKVPMDVNGDFPIVTCVYKETDKKNLKMDIYYPINHSNRPLPLVYFAHGGGWISGFRNQPNNVSWCRYLASKGFAVASIDYRYGYTNNMDDILTDYRDGLEYIKLHNIILNIDINNMVLMGLSAGGHLALLYSAYNSSKNNKESMKGIKSVIAYYSPSNLMDLFKIDNKSIFAKFGVARTLKGTPSSEEEIYKYYSPINWISKRMVPTLIVHGKLDNIVPIESSINLVKRFDEVKVPSTFLIHKKGEHSFDTQLKDYTTINILEKTVRFIKGSLRGD